MQALLVEDHGDTRSVLGMLLNDCGCHTITAKNLHEARSLLEEMRFDFLISDLNRPDGDGVALVREAKEAQSLKAIALTRPCIGSRTGRRPQSRIRSLPD